VGAARRGLRRDRAPDDARAALRKGVDASYRFGHAGMAADLEARLDELE
jgi:hypothetical protein